MYAEFYQMQGDPFKISPSGATIHEHSSYAKARMYLEYALNRREGIVLVTGRPGTGKTTLIRDFVHSFNGSSSVVLELSCQSFNTRELITHFSVLLGIRTIDGGISAAFMRIQEALIQFRKRGQHVILVLDEAQSLSDSVLEQARLFSNFDLDGQPLVQIVLVGHPGLQEKILSPALEQLHQRVIAACVLWPLDGEQVKEYVLQRLSDVDWQGTPEIDDGVYDIVYGASDGIPRWINQIFSRLFLRGMLEKKTVLGTEDATEVVNDLISELLLPPSVRKPRIRATN